MTISKNYGTALIIFSLSPTGCDFPDPMCLGHESNGEFAGESGRLHREWWRTENLRFFFEFARR